MAFFSVLLDIFRAFTYYAHVEFLGLTMPPLRRGRMPARARAGRGRPYGHRQRGATEDAAEAGDNNMGNQVPTVTPVEVRDPEAQADATLGVVEARRMENLIMDSWLK